ncbi:MAG: glycosyltransferase family 9 protein [Nitrospinota bacterium]|nr:glycosyltransferase family 9 protein [Nitrospinota bacterium]
MANQVLHTIEKKAKQMLWNLVGACAGKAPNPPDLPLDFTGIQTVLVIRPDRLGDVVLSTPVYETLKKAFPHLHISVLAASAQAELLADNPNISQVFVFDPKQPLNVFRQLRDEQFDLALTLNKKFSATATFFTLCSGAKIRVGYNHPENAWAHNIRVSLEGPPRHESENNLDLLWALGIEEIQSQPRLYFNSAETRKIADLMQQYRPTREQPVVMVKSGTRIAKWGWRWEKFQTVIERLLELDKAQVWLVNGPGEEAELQTAIANMQRKPQLLPLLTAKELALLMQECDVLLCNHTGIMHLASAVDKPVCVIFKHGEIKRWGPLNSGSVVLEERDDDSLSPDTVLNTLLEMLNKEKS